MKCVECGRDIPTPTPNPFRCPSCQQIAPPGDDASREAAKRMSVRGPSPACLVCGGLPPGEASSAGDLCYCVSPAGAEQEKLDAETDRAIREYLWSSHGHQGLYGDDGEMQCGACIPTWDYLRAPLADVIAAAQKARFDANIKALARASSSAAPRRDADTEAER